MQKRVVALFEGVSVKEKKKTECELLQSKRGQPKVETEAQIEEDSHFLIGVLCLFFWSVISFSSKALLVVQEGWL